MSGVVFLLQSLFYTEVDEHIDVEAKNQKLSVHVDSSMIHEACITLQMKKKQNQSEVGL